MSPKFSLLPCVVVTLLEEERGKDSEFHVLGNNIEHKAAFQGKTQNSFDSDHGHLILNHTFHVLFPHSREKKRKTQEFWGYRDTRRKRNRTLISPSACAQPLQDLSLGKVTLSGKCSTSLSLKIFNCKMGII